MASSGDDGCVRLWQANYLGVWLPISVIAPDGSHSSALPPPGANEVNSKAAVCSLMTQLPMGLRAPVNDVRMKMASHGDSEQSKKRVLSLCFRLVWLGMHLFVPLSCASSRLDVPQFRQPGFVKPDGQPTMWR